MIHSKKQHKPLTKNPGCFYSVLCTNKLICLSKLYLKSYLQLLLHNHIIHYQKFMKTYLQINESKIPLSKVTHSATSFTPRNSIHATTQYRRHSQGLCNKEHTKQFRSGCGMDSSTHMHNVKNTPLKVYFI